MKLLDWTIDQIWRARFYPSPQLISFLISNFTTQSHWGNSHTMEEGKSDNWKYLIAPINKIISKSPGEIL